MARKRYLMITWNEHLVCTDDLSDYAKSIRRRLRFRKAASATTFAIAFSTNEDNLFDIYNMGELLFRYHRDSDEDVRIVGLATSRESACELVSKMLAEIYEKTGAFDVRSYFT